MAAPMMKCGHAANGTRGGEPVCVICLGITPGAAEVDLTCPLPLAGRTARCVYYGSIPTGRSHGSNYGCRRGEPCRCEQPSSPDLPFFKHRPDRDHDEFYCGCWGWD